LGIESLSGQSELGFPYKSMKILILGLNYLPESTSIGPYTAELAEHLHDCGHHVRVVTGFPTAPHWRVWPGYQDRKFMCEVINGVQVTRTWLYVPGNPRSTLQRILFDSSFAISSLAGVWGGPRANLVVVISPPLQLAVTALLVGALTGARVFLHIKDLVPDAAVATGALRSGGLAIRAAYSLEHWVYQHVDGIGVICDGMKRNLAAKGVPEDKVMVLPDYIDPDFVRPLSSQNSFRSRLGIEPQDFLVMYSGSVGGKQGLQTFVQAAAAFERDDLVRCCLIGDGPHLSELKQAAQQRSMCRFRFLPMQPRAFLPEQLSAADVLVITQRKAVRDVVFPGKLLYYMAAGRAILAAVSEDSETGRFIRENEVGMVVPPEEPNRLADAIRWMRAHPERTHEFGQNGRLVVERQFDRTLVLKRFARHLEGLTQLSDDVHA
jgi:colanic acid biosynthesis glycosyl transferase WcaI